MHALDRSYIKKCVKTNAAYSNIKMVKKELWLAHTQILMHAISQISGGFFKAETGMNKALF